VGPNEWEDYAGLRRVIVLLNPHHAIVRQIRWIGTFSYDPHDATVPQFP
jgi:hypothetical protein